MNLISKVCVLFLVWLVIGFAVIMGYILVYTAKVLMIDEERSDDIYIEFLKLLSFGLIDFESGDKKDDVKQKIDSASPSPKAMAWAKMLILWPSYLSTITWLVPDSYEVLKNKYQKKSDESVS